MNFIKNFQNFSEENKETLISYILAEKVRVRIEYEVENQKLGDEDEFITRLKNEHPIKYQVDCWNNHYFRDFIRQNNKITDMRREKRLTDEIDNNHENAKFLILENNKQVQFKDANFALAEASLATPEMHYVLRQLWPFQYEVNEYKYLNNEQVEVKNYNLVKSRDFIVMSDGLFWRQKLMLCRFAASYNNILIFCYWFCYNSPFGIKSLFSTSIDYDYNCDYKTGKIKIEKVFSMISTISDLCSSVSESRRSP